MEFRHRSRNEMIEMTVKEIMIALYLLITKAIMNWMNKVFHCVWISLFINKWTLNKSRIKMNRTFVKSTTGISPLYKHVRPKRPEPYHYRLVLYPFSSSPIRFTAALPWWRESNRLGSRISTVSHRICSELHSLSSGSLVWK